MTQNVSRGPECNVDQEKEIPEAKLIESIYTYYREHKNDCDNEYALAMDPNISTIYTNTEDKKKIKKALAKVSIVILTANKYEKNILHQHIFKKTGVKILKARITLFEKPATHNIANAYFFEWEGYDILHIACQTTGSYTIGGCADAVRYCINSPVAFPTAFISFGICFGCRDEEDHLCETIISKKVYPYFIGAKVNGKTLRTVDDYVLGISSDMENRIQEFVDENQFFSSDKPDLKVEFNNYITGEAVVSSRIARDMFKGTTTQTIYAGDMEAYGLFKECNNAYRDIPCAVIKSICDWGVEKNLNSPEIFEKVMGYNSEEEIKTIKDRLQALATAYSFIALEILLKGKENGEGENEKLFEISIYKRIRDKIKIKKNERVIDKERMAKEAGKLNKELNNSIASDFIEALCENLADELSVKNKEKYIVKGEE